MSIEEQYRRVVYNAKMRPQRRDPVQAVGACFGVFGIVDILGGLWK